MALNHTTICHYFALGYKCIREFNKILLDKRANANITSIIFFTPPNKRAPIYLHNNSAYEAQNPLP